MFRTVWAGLRLYRRMQTRRLGHSRPLIGHSSAAQTSHRPLHEPHRPPTGHSSATYRPVHEGHRPLIGHPPATHRPLTARPHMGDGGAIGHPIGHSPATHRPPIGHFSLGKSKVQGCKSPILVIHTFLPTRLGQQAVHIGALYQRCRSLSCPHLVRGKPAFSLGIAAFPFFIDLCQQ